MLQRLGGATTKTSIQLNEISVSQRPLWSKAKNIPDENMRRGIASSLEFWSLQLQFSEKTLKNQFPLSIIPDLLISSMRNSQQLALIHKTQST